MIPLPVLPALAMFSTPVTAYDEVSAEDANRRYTTTREANRTISGSFQPATDRDLQFLPQGDVSKGVQAFVTTQTLSIKDTSMVDGQVLRQTFLIGDGETWRVTAQARWGRYGGFNRYLCAKHLDLEEAP